MVQFSFDGIRNPNILIKQDIRSLLTLNNKYAPIDI